MKLSRKDEVEEEVITQQSERGDNSFIQAHRYAFGDNF